MIGVILAGGRATRMGGGDKCLMEIGGRPLLARIRDRLAPQVETVVLNANGDPARFAAFGLPVVPDPVPGRPGPLAGVLAGMEAAAARGARHVVTAPGDAPFLPPDLAARLRAGAAAARLPLACAASPDATGTLRRHPVFGFWPVAFAPALRAALEAGERKAARVADRLGCAVVAFAPGPPDPFLNVNTPEDRDRAERLAAAAAR